MERLHYGWQDNAAGMRFSSYYGFGVVDAGELVKAAAKCDDDPMCVEMGKPAEVYTSSNESPCSYEEGVLGSENQISENNIVCTFNGFKNKDDQKELLGANCLPLTRLRLNFPGLPIMPVIRYTINARSWLLLLKKECWRV